MKKLLSRSWAGTETWYHNDGETVAIETRQDVSKLLDLNRRLRNEFQGYKDEGEHHHHLYARIPPVVITQWRNEGIDIFDPDHADMVKKKLNDPEWRYLRTTEGWV